LQLKQTNLPLTAQKKYFALKTKILRSKQFSRLKTIFRRSKRFSRTQRHLQALNAIFNRNLPLTVYHF